MATKPESSFAPENTTFAGERESVTKSLPCGSKFATLAWVSLCQPASPTCGSFKPSLTWCVYSFPNSSACVSAPQLSFGAAGDAAGDAPGDAAGAAPGAPAAANTSFFWSGGVVASATERSDAIRHKQEFMFSSWAFVTRQK